MHEPTPQYLLQQLKNHMFSCDCVKPTKFLPRGEDLAMLFCDVFQASYLMDHKT